MQTNNLDVFEARAEGLISKAMRLSRENDANLELPQPEDSSHQLMQYSVAAFVAATKILIFTFRRFYFSPSQKVSKI